MRLTTILIVLLTLTACGGTVTRLGPGKELEAVRDYVAASELTEVQRIRVWEQIKWLYVNDHFIVLPQRRSVHLIEFRSRCDELRQRQWAAGMIDHRVSARYLYSDHDTIRGCVIRHIYELSDLQLEELRYLGDAPGEEIFMTSED
ncbi:MAG: DUF6491 family protein [Woeseiaceae bacterium]|nr:DUF6491 family protein [Woeseiaceae bacterium]